MKRNGFLKGVLGLGFLSLWSCRADGDKARTATTLAGNAGWIMAAKPCFHSIYEFRLVVNEYTRILLFVAL